MAEHCTYCGAPRDPAHDKPWRCKRCGALVPWAAPPPPGHPIEFGPYTLVRRIAAGGMGVVYEARRKTVQGFEKAFAIKRLLPALSSDRDFVDMIVDEAKICAQLEHPNIVQVFELDQVEGEYYMAMEYVAGGTMAAMLRFSAATRRLMPVPVVLHVVAEALKGLAHAHGSGRGGSGEAIIHRDVSPQNIMLGRDGRVKLTDFGIAKAMASSTVSRIGTVKGKLAYMAPELLGGQRATPRVDVFAMGVLMHEAFSSRRLFRAETEAALISTVLRGEIPPLARYRSDVPRSIEQVILGALARDPTQRYPDARALRDHFMQSLPPGMLEAGLSQSEKYIAEFYDIVGLPGETMDPVNDAPLKGRRVTPEALRPSLSDSFPTISEPARSRRPRWLAPLGVGALGLLVAFGGWLALRDGGASAAVDAGLASRDAQVAPDAGGAVAPLVDAAPAAGPVDASATVDARPRPRPLLRKLTVADIERTFNKHMAALNACGAQHRAVLPAGGVKIALVIAQDGRVKKAVLAPTSIQGTGLDRCLSQIVARMRFPAHKDAEMSVTVPLEFQIQ